MIHSGKQSINGAKKRMLLQGQIRTLSNYTQDKWARREIIVRKDAASGYPRIRDRIRLMDSDGEVYDLTFIKGANKSGYTCLGQPGTLKRWFEKHYRWDVVDDDTVFLEAKGLPTGEFGIWTSREWTEKEQAPSSLPIDH